MDIVDQKFARNGAGAGTKMIELARATVGASGKIYLAQRDFARAEPDLLKAIELDPKLEPAYLLLAQLYVASNKQLRAIRNSMASSRKTGPFPH